MAQILAFDRWDTNGITVEDPGLERYISVEPRLVPKSGARYHGNRFHKSKVFIVERLINKVLVPGHKGKKHVRSSKTITGKAHTAYTLVYDALAVVEQKTKKNPIAVFVKAIENAAPREEIITIEYGGARYPKAVECAPQRRIDVVLRLMVQGALQKSINSKLTMVNALADEIINAHGLNQASNAISKKLDVERQADASR
jgi:small subunit ribosomal protein S7|tara:strand:- start:159 stop:758 length:600 start_codon:yes stop_codon:yes gene_type:complete